MVEFGNSEFKYRLERAPLAPVAAATLHGWQRAGGTQPARKRATHLEPYEHGKRALPARPRPPMQQHTSDEACARGACATNNARCAALLRGRERG